MLARIAKRWFRGRRYSSLQRSLERARISGPPSDYARKILSTTIIAAGLGFFMGAMLPILLLGSPPPLILVLSTVVGGLAIAGLSYMGWMLYPSIRAGSLSSNMDPLLPQSTAYMYALSSGGLGLMDVLKSLAEREEEYGEVAREAGRIVHDVEYFGADARSAIAKTAETTPSKKFRRLLESMVAVVQMGGNLPEYFSDKYRELHEDAVHQQKSFLETLSILGELYVIIFVITPTILLILSVVGSMIGMFSMDVLGIVICVVFPFVTAIFLIILSCITKGMPGRKSSKKTAAKIKGGKGARIARKRRREFELLKFLASKPAYVFVGSIPAAVLYLAATFFFFGPLEMFHLVVAFTAATLPFIIFYEYRERKISRIEERVPDFLREISSASASGLSLPRAIRAISSEQLGAIGPYVRRMQNNLEWGMPISEALSEFANDTQSSEVWRVVTLIQKVGESGGDMAKVANIAEDEITTSKNMARERRVTMLTYLLIVYVGFGVFLFTVYMINSSIFTYVTPTGAALGMQTGSAFDPAEATAVLFNASMIQGLCSGVVAGAMSTGKVQSGIKHSLILIILAYIVFGILI